MRAQIEGVSEETRIVTVIDFYYQEAPCPFSVALTRQAKLP